MSATLIVMLDERLDTELAAHEAFTAWIAEGKRIRGLFEAAEHPLPSALARMFGEADSDRRRRNAQSVLPIDPPRPKVANDDWLWVPETELTAAKLALALLRDQREPITATELFNKLKARRPDASRGTLFNIGPRLEGDILNRSEDGWTIREPSKVPMLSDDGFAWGPPEAFTKTELAGHRRTILLYVLGQHPEGMQIVPLVRLIEQMGACKAPLNKDLVKGDFDLLRSEGKIKRKPGSPKKWVLV